MNPALENFSAAFDNYPCIVHSSFDLYNFVFSTKQVKLLQTTNLNKL